MEEDKLTYLTTDALTNFKMNSNEVQLLLDTQRKCFNDSIARLEQQFLQQVKSNEKRFAEIVSSLEFTQGELQDAKNKLHAQTNTQQPNCNQVAELHKENQQLRQQLADVIRRLDYQDDQARKPNLRFCGITESTQETREQCQVKLARILSDAFTITPQFEHVYRVGKVNNSRQSRDIVARFSKQEDRDEVLRNRRKMKGTTIYINEDLCPGTVESRKAQMNDYHEAKRRGKMAFFNYRTLVVRDRRPGTTNMRETALEACPTAATDTTCGPRGDGRRVERPASSPLHPNPPAVLTPNTPPPTTSLHDFPPLMQHPNQHPTEDSRLPSSSLGRTPPTSVSGGDNRGHTLGANRGGIGEAGRVLNATLYCRDDGSHDTGRMKRQRIQTQHYQPS